MKDLFACYMIHLQDACLRPQWQAGQLNEGPLCLRHDPPSGCLFKASMAGRAA